MKRLVLLLIALGVATVSAMAENQEDAFLSATRLRESKNQDWMTGSFGERGSYQFRQSTWRLHTRASFELAYNREVANAVAHRHYLWLIKRLEECGVPATPYNIACAWNAGAGNVARGTLSRAAREYGECVNNLTAETLRRQTPPVKPKAFVVRLESFVPNGTNVHVNLASRPPQTPTFALWRPAIEVPAVAARQIAPRIQPIEVTLDTRAIAVDIGSVALILVANNG
jgi:hypothetical protein